MITARPDPSLGRGAGPGRKTQLNPRRKTPRRSERVRDAAFLSWLHETQSCCVRRYLATLDEFRIDETLACSGPKEADHMGQRPHGRRADDGTAVILCQFHHRCRHDFSGPFKGWTRIEMAAFKAWAIAETQAAYARRTA